MLEAYHQEKISLEKIVQKMCHNPAILFDISKRGFIQEGFYADFLIVNGDPVKDISKVADRKNHRIVVKNGVHIN